MVVPEIQETPHRHHHQPRVKTQTQTRSSATSRQQQQQPIPKKVPLKQLLKVSSIAAGIQFGWALQLSLLTPYVQELGIPHVWSSLIWLCGPLSGLLVQPLVGHSSDGCTSRFGRRRPFILAGAVSICLAVLIIGHSADLGRIIGDDVSVTNTRPRAIIVFVIGFWLLDVANNMTQGPCRALLADLTGDDQRRTRIANAYFSLFMAVGNVLGFATGAFSGWYRLLPFTVTSACSISCANLKSAFLLDIIVIATTAYLSLASAKEVPLSSIDERPGESQSEAFLWEMLGIFRHLSWSIWIILIVTSLTWIGWFPFLLYDTDWMGREIYKGKPNEGLTYTSGVQMGSFGLMLNSVVLGVASVLMERLCKKWGGGFVWGISNILMALCFIMMVVISLIAKNMEYSGKDTPPTSIVIASLTAFAVLGAPLAVTYSVPYAMIASRTESLGLGQGLSMGVLNISIVIPQVVVSLGSGPWDQLFGGGNSPAFAVAAVAAFVSGLLALLALPRSRPEKPRIRL
ncbi:Sucrose transport protein [Thalictrum thalictroides]|uniref:Sucrose transport protein n=1 Tax=Thalictrum thalictroides TaxID=46969 RepID=A0A7J6W825_THATH|nr:Sucrose transport protein [Thalictrum thalictroides]